MNSRLNVIFEMRDEFRIELIRSLKTELNEVSFLLTVPIYNVS